MNKKTIRCPDHKDKHASAAIFTRPDGSEWLHCLGCGANRLFKEGDKNLRNEVYIEDEVYDVGDFGVDIKHCLNPLELLEDLARDKGITSEMLDALGGFVTDEYYLGFKYGNGREVYRNLAKDNRPRFINVGGNKGLMNDEIIDHYDEWFLVEGLTDWAMFKYFIRPNVTTSFGAEISDEQAYLLRGKTVFMLFDRDFAGYRGSKQAEAKLMEYGATPINFELPNGFNLKPSGKVDVGYLIHKELEEFRNWIDFKVRRYKTFDDTYVDRFKKRDPLHFYKTDIPFIRFTQGLYVLTGPPGVGKTTAGISFTDNFQEQGGSVLYVNYDLPEDQIVARLASRYTDAFSWAEIEAMPHLLNDEREAEEKLKQCLKRVKVMTKLTPSELKHCKKYYTHMVIDYLQRVPNNHPDQRVGLEHLMDDLSDMGVTDGMTVVGISRESLNGNKFSGTAAIEYHAQGAMILDKTDNDIVSCEIRKNTRGKTGHTLYKVDYPHQKLVPTKLSGIADDKFRTLWGEEDEKDN